MSTVATPGALSRFEVQPPANVTLTPAPIASAAQLALSPDGRRLAFIATRRRAASQLWIRPLDDAQAQPLPGTEGRVVSVLVARRPVHRVFRRRQAQEDRYDRGVPQVLSDASIGRGGTWNPDGIIVFAGRGNSPISRISASGGIVTAATTFDPDRAVIGQSWPQFSAGRPAFSLLPAQLEARVPGNFRERARLLVVHTDSRKRLDGRVCVWAPAVRTGRDIVCAGV
jgi:hypothetical protein